MYLTPVDVSYMHTCLDILANGNSDQGFHVRPKWKDGTPAHTKKVLFKSFTYDVSNFQFPILNFRRQNWKNAIDEILWIYQKGSNELCDLNSKIWDSWNVGDGTIGKAYGYQISKKFRHHKFTEMEFEKEKYISAKLPGELVVEDGYVMLNQMEAILYDLTHDPMSRRIMTNTYVHDDLVEMGLAPCAYQVVFNVTVGNNNKMILNMCVNQRSQDMVTAGNWNLIQYCALLFMVSIHVGMTPGIITHNIFDCHIYDRHENCVLEMLQNHILRISTIMDTESSTKIARQYRPILKNAEKEIENKTSTYDDILYAFDMISVLNHDSSPRMSINPTINNFYDFDVTDFELPFYKPSEAKINFEVAI